MSHEGHRERIIQKIDSDTLCEHEYLEILLFNAFKRCNTNDLAHRLLAEFGSIQGVFGATVEQLCRVKGIGKSAAAYLCVIGKFYNRYYAVNGKCFPDQFEATEFLPFVKREYSELTSEVMDFYFLDNEGNIFKRKRFADGRNGEVEMEPSELTRIIVENEPAGLVLVHNHPEGKARPSEADVAVTKSCQFICSCNNIMFCDHLIYAPEGIYSCYLSGELKDISAGYSVRGIMESKRREEKKNEKQPTQVL